jgi:hypothetical protein
MLGVADAPCHVAFNDQVFLVPRQKLARPRIVNAQPAVEVSGALKKPLGVQTGVGNGAHRPAELGNERELGFTDGEECQPGQQD